ncbi:5434_t:CDS:2 [Rhizophagus irregularis]|nr:5434_t:CDS:2 [Rhizophagus irregularis]
MLLQIDIQNKLDWDNSASNTNDEDSIFASLPQMNKTTLSANDTDEPEWNSSKKTLTLL